MYLLSLLVLSSYIYLNFDALVERFSIVPVIAVPGLMSIILFRGGNDLVERMRRDKYRH